MSKLRSHFVKAGANFSAVDKDGCTSLIATCRNGHELTARVLVDAGADVDAVQHDDRGPLLMACQEGHDNVVKMRIEAGVDIDVADQDLDTPLHVCGLPVHKDMNRLCRS